MKKAQITLFVIAGLVLVVLLGILITNMRTDQTSILSDQTKEDGIIFNQRQNFQNYFESCVKSTLLMANSIYGMNIDKKTEYENFVSLDTKECVDGFLDELTNEGYEIKKEDIKTNLEINDNTLIVGVDYPVEISIDDKAFLFKEVIQTFKRITTVYLSNGIVNTDTTIKSTDNKATLVLKAGTVVTDAEGKPLDSVSIRVEDVHFDGLENNIVVGNLVYEGLPKGAQFSKPIDIKINFRGKDYPIYTAENSLSIAYWDEEFKIWRGLDTQINDGYANAKANHFTVFSVVIGCSASTTENTVIVKTPYLFKQKYYLKQEELPILEIDESTTDAIIYNYQTRLQEQKDEQKELNQYFCENAGNEFWQYDDDTVIPTRGRYIDILENKEQRIDLSIQELAGEKTTFGTEEDKCDEEVDVPMYCCCSLNEDNVRYDCLNEDLEPAFGKLQCYDLKRSSAYLFSDTMENNLDKCIFQGDMGVATPITTTNKRQIFGYNSPNCIGGTTEDGDGDNSILTISFDNKGGTCLADDNPITIETYYNDVLDTDNSCDITYPKDPNEQLKLITVNDQSNLIIEKVEVKTSLTQDPFTQRDTENFCATCRAVIKIKGTGVQASGAVVCESEEESIYDGGVCYKCEEDADTGLILATGQGGDCSCNRQTLGLAYCDGVADDGTKGKIICTNEFNNGKFGFHTWTDPNNICEDCSNSLTENDAKCDIAFYAESSQGDEQ